MKSRTYSSSLSSSSSSSSSTDLESSAEEMVETPLSSHCSVTGSEVPDINTAKEIPNSIVAYAPDTAFQGLSKSAKKAMTHETPVPFLRRSSSEKSRLVSQKVFKTKMRYF